MHKQSLIAEIMNYMVSSYVYFVALTLVLYMVSSLVTGVLTLISGLSDLSLTSQNVLSAPERAALEFSLLHTIAFTIVLVKAYKILIAYAETRHINIKFLVEIAIIAPTIELIFNARSYSLGVNILFATFAFFNLIAYLYFYKTVKTVSSDYMKESHTVVTTEHTEERSTEQKRVKKRAERPVKV